MLTVPSVSSTVSVASAVVSVRSSLIRVTELVTGQNGRSPPRMGQYPNMSEGVDVVWRVDGQTLAVAFRIVGGDESVGSAAGAGRET